MAGVVLGVGAALVLSGFLEGLLYGVGSVRPIAFVSVPLLLLAVTLVACWIPARRALDADPAAALRTE